VGTQDVPVLKTVYFAFNRADLSPEALKTLRENVNWLRTHTDVGVKTEGRCDDRGTEEYNLALGDRRVRAVWQYYTHDGISTSRIETISYGKDKPVCTEDTPSCWAQNRQVDAVIEPAGMTTK
jgi:peptidoglycan-associated lipoprotein